MKTLPKPLCNVGLITMLLLSVAGCEQKSSQASASSSAAVASSADTTVSSMAAGAACEGVAPSGDLNAVRIEAANTTRTEPGLYEGPVWINDSLYFSDFVFSEGFPSRIQKLDASGQMTTAIASRSRYIPWLFVAGFAIVVAVNATMITFAVGSFSGLYTPKPRERGLHYNGVVAEQKSRDALGWRIDCSFGGAYKFLVCGAAPSVPTH